MNKTQDTYLNFTHKLLHKNWSNTYLWIFLFSCLFIGLNILLYLNTSPIKSHCDIDSSAYLENGLLFFKNSSFSARQTLPYYGLGYPLLIGFIYKLFGQSILAIIIVQVILALMSGLLIFSIAQKLFNTQVALISFIFFSINLGFLTFTQFILTEIFLTFWLILFFERFITFIKTRNISSVALAGFALGFSIIIKPAAIYYPLLLAFLLIFIITGPLKTKLKHILLFITCFCAPILGYKTHNYIVFNEFKTGALQEINMCYWLFPNILAEHNKTNSDIERQKLQDMGSIQTVKTYFIEFTKAHPFLLIYVWAKNVLKTWLGLFSTNLKVLIDPQVHPGQISYFKMPGNIYQKAKAYITAGTDITWLKIVSFYEAIWSILRLFLAFIALFYLLIQKKYALLFLFISYLFYFSIITGHDGCARFRILFEFILLILAALGAYVIITKIRKKQLS